MSSIAIAYLVVGVRIPASRFTISSMEQSCQCEGTNKSMAFCPTCGKKLWVPCRQPGFACKQMPDGSFMTDFSSKRDFDIVFYDGAVLGSQMSKSDPPYYSEEYVYIGKAFRVIAGNGTDDDRGDLQIDTDDLDVPNLRIALYEELSTRALWSPAKFGYWLISRMS
jgi:hypothetical protein